MKEKIIQRRIPHPTERRPIIQKAATFASLEGRLSHDLSAETSLRGSQGFLHETTRRMSQTISNHLPGAVRRASQAGMHEEFAPKLPTYSEEISEAGRQRQRSSTIQFEEPLYSPTRWRTAETVETQSPQNGPMLVRPEESNQTTPRDQEKGSSTLSPVSPGATPPISASNGVPIPPPAARLGVPIDSRSRTGSVSPRDTGNVSLFRRLTERFPQLQMQPSSRTSSSGSLSPKEQV